MAFERVAAIVDRRVGDDIHPTGLWIDLDLGNVYAVGKGERRFRRGLGIEVLVDRAVLF